MDNPLHINFALRKHPDWKIDDLERERYYETDEAVYTYDELIRDNIISYEFCHELIKGLDGEKFRRFAHHLLALVYGLDLHDAYVDRGIDLADLSLLLTATVNQILQAYYQVLNG